MVNPLPVLFSCFSCSGRLKRLCWFVLLTMFTAVQASEPVVLQLKWKHQFQFAGFYAAQKEGFYEDEGLSVTINPFDGSGRVLDEVLSGAAQFGIADSSIVLSRMNGDPVVVVAAVFQHSPLGLLSLKTSEILSPLELKGKRVMYLKNADDAAITAMLSEMSVSDSDFTHIDHNFNDLALLGPDAVDAMAVYFTDQPYFYQQQGVAVNQIAPSNYGIDFYGDLLFTQEDYLASHPHKVEAFRRASLKGWQYALDHPEAMVDWILENLETEKTRDHLLFEARQTAKMIRPDLIELGHFSVSRIQRIASVYRSLNLVDEGLPLDGIDYQNYRNQDDSVPMIVRILGIVVVIMIAIISVSYLINKRLKNRVAVKTEQLQRKSFKLSKIKDHLEWAQVAAGQGSWELTFADDKLWWSVSMQRLLQLEDVAVPSFVVYSSHLHSDDRERVYETLQALKQAPTDYQMSYRFKTEQGNELYLDETIKVLRDRADCVIGLQGIVQDVTERKRAENKILASERLYRQMFDENTAVKLLIESASGDILRANEAAREFYGYDQNTLLSMNITDINTLTPEETYQEMKLAVEQKRKFYRFSHRLANGEIRDVEVHTGPVDAGGKQALLSIIIDVTKRNEYERALKDNEMRTRLAQKSSGLSVWEFNIQTRQLFLSEEMKTALSIDDRLYDDVFKSIGEVVHPADVERWRQSIRLSINSGANHDLKFRIRDARQQLRWIHAIGECQFDENGVPVKLTGVCKDISEEYEKESQLRLAASVFSHAQEGIIITDTSGKIIETNEAFHQITGYSKDEVLGKNPSLLSSGNHDKSFYQNMWQQLLSEGRWQGKLWNKTKDGELFAEYLTISAVTNSQGECSHYVGVFSDITEQEEREEYLIHAAYHDPLTALPNRKYLHKEMRKRLARKADLKFSVIFIDLDGFKPVNDTHGHEAGDKLLVAIGQRLQSLIRENDLVARVGGDEFVILVDQLSESQELKKLADRLLASAAEPLVVHGHVLTVSASIGCILVNSGCKDSVDELIDQADGVMYQAKQQGKNCCVIKTCCAGG